MPQRPNTRRQAPPWNATQSPIRSYTMWKCWFGDTTVWGGCGWPCSASSKFSSILSRSGSWCSCRSSPGSAQLSATIYFPPRCAVTPVFATPQQTTPHADPTNKCGFSNWVKERVPFSALLGALTGKVVLWGETLGNHRPTLLTLLLEQSP